MMLASNYPVNEKTANCAAVCRLFGFISPTMGSPSGNPATPAKQLHHQK
jgi:hypothetical protein